MGQVWPCLPCRPGLPRFSAASLSVWPDFPRSMPCSPLATILHVLLLPERHLSFAAALASCSLVIRGWLPDPGIVLAPDVSCCCCCWSPSWRHMALICLCLHVFPGSLFP